MTPRLFDDGGRWHQVKRCDPRAVELADRHYSRQTPGAAEFMANGRTLVLLTDDGLAVWGAIECRDPAGGLHWRCSIFRNEGQTLSSDLIREATARTFAYWRNHYGGLPLVPLRTEVDMKRTRRKRDPGRCFIRAGWRVIGRSKGKAKGAGELVVLQAPHDSQQPTAPPRLGDPALSRASVEGKAPASVPTSGDGLRPAADPPATTSPEASGSGSPDRR